MLTAVDSAGRMVTLLNCGKVQLEKVRRQAYYCPGCGAKLRLKAGAKKVPHFAHFPNVECNFHSEWETAEHLEGKRKLFNWLAEQGLQVELEKYFYTIRQRVDLYTEVGSEKYAFEYQCSVIPSEDIQKRTIGYLEEGITPIWILSYRHLYPKKKNQYRLSSFQWHMAFGQPVSPTLCFYSPILHEFTLLHQMTPFSSVTSFASSRTTNATHTPLSSIFMKPGGPFRLGAPWKKQKMNWRLTGFRNATIRDSFFNALYRAGFTTATLKEEIGMPVPYMHFYETKALEWQFWIYEGLIHRKKRGTCITVPQIKRKVGTLIREKKIVLRDFPGLNGLGTYLPAMSYIDLLKRFGILTEKSKGIYMIAFPPVTGISEQDMYRKAEGLFDEYMKKGAKA
ncbi:MAG: competence protein CoiA [Bacillus sp. (in: firmicutes)]